MSQRNASGWFLAVWLAGCGGGNLGGTAGAPGAGVAGAGGSIGSGGAGRAGLDAGGGSGTIGAAGSTGTGGTVGSGGYSAGGGETGFIGCAWDPFGGCGPGACGNGMRDSCLLPANKPVCGDKPFTEVCDGTDLGDESCAKHGYGSGTISCAADCTADVSACSECVVAPNILSCGDAPQISNAVALQIAATDTEVAVAWVEDSAAADPKLHITRLSPTLDFVGDSGFVDSTLAGVSLALAPLPSGWIAAGVGFSDAFVHGVDASGADLGRQVLDQLPAPEFGGPVILIPRPGHGPLVVWQIGRDTIRAAVVSDDGRSISTPRELPFPSAWPQQLVWEGEFVNGAFYVLTSDWKLDGSPFHQYRMSRVEADGTPTATFEVLPGVLTSRTMLVRGADALELISSVTAPATHLDVTWQKIDSTGAAASTRSVISPLSEFNDWVSATSFGADSVVLIPLDTGSNAVTLERVDASGVVTAPPYQVGFDPDRWDWGFTLARRGPDIVVGWVDILSKVRLARVTP